MTYSRTYSNKSGCRYHKYQKITVEAKGEILQLKDTINRMVEQLNSFGAEVTRVAKEVGTEGKLGGQAEVKGVAQNYGRNVEVYLDSGKVIVKTAGKKEDVEL